MEDGLAHHRAGGRSRFPLALAWAAYGAGEVRLESELVLALELLDRAVRASGEVGERMVAGAARRDEDVAAGRRLGDTESGGPAREIVGSTRS